MRPLCLAALVALSACGLAACQDAPPATPPAVPDTPTPGATSASPAAGSETSAPLPASVSSDTLKALLPTAVGDLARQSVTAEQDGAMGLTVSRAEAVYGTGPQAVTLLVVDVGSAEGARLMGLTVPATGRLNGRPVQRTQTATEASVRYQVGGRYIVEARGAGVGMDLLDVFVKSINLAALPGGA